MGSLLCDHSLTIQVDSAGARMTLQDIIKVFNKDIEKIEDSVEDVSQHSAGRQSVCSRECPGCLLAHGPLPQSTKKIHMVCHILQVKCAGNDTKPCRTQYP